jgi:hypothetical protein
MKYFTEDIEFTHSKDYFSKEGFLLDGVCYDNVNAGLVSSLVNYTEIVKSYICRKFSDDEDLEISVPLETFLKKKNILPEDMSIEDMSIVVDLVPTVNPRATQYLNITLPLNSKNSRLKDWVKIRVECPDIHSKLAEVDEELMLCKVKEVENTYVFFWFSRTRDNSICKFTTEDSIEDIIKEFDRWLDNKLEFKERYEIPADKYIGWISNA